MTSTLGKLESLAECFYSRIPSECAYYHSECMVEVSSYPRSPLHLPHHGTEFDQRGGGVAPPMPLVVGA